VKNVNQIFTVVKIRINSLNPVVILLILLLPLFFINIHGYTDWGDDFALYLHQAKKIAECQSPQDTRLIYNEDNPVMIANVSVGFSILLVPVYLIFGLNFKAFSVYMTIFLVLAGISLFYFFRKYIPVWISVLMVLLIVYHRFTLDFKQYVLSDIPFIAFFFFLIYQFEKHREYSIRFALLMGLLIGYLMNIRSIGIVFPLAVLANLIPGIFGFFNKKSSRFDFSKQFIFSAVVVVTSFATFFIIKKIAFPKPAEGGYLSYFLQHDVNTVILKNVKNYLDWFQWFFTFKKITHGIQLLFYYIFTILMLIGLINKIRKSVQLTDWLFFLTVFILLIYPANPGFRYLLPVMPFLFIYFYFGMLWLSRFLNKKWLKVQYLIPVLLLVLYYPGIVWHIETKDYPSGTEQASAQEIFSYITENTPEDAVIVFKKPRALSLYTNRYGLANNSQERNPFRLDYLYKKYKVNYFLENTTEIPDSALIIYLKAFPSRNKLIYSNNEFRLYKFLP